ncbi:hypothetical protein HM1_1202 [Heliomicrobium modesticaldum Ice1]|uniref:FlgN protein n=1 Tax=Heliobacterium modesticaldum (strain ATCC 51547 / Ice1) TaxID=498761 RepID=B0TH47_HELMI|nr:flagellar protein FlgN [Heliomicrobium modesticaldum]ABZ83372.1 hypothetical protein HM1_1202 [Heliomicrobium modesticaldum Ice1]
MKTSEQVPSGYPADGNPRGGLFQRLDELLSAQQRMMQGLLRLAKRQEEAIKKSDIQEIQKNTEMQQVLILQSGQLEQQRLKLCAEIIAHLGIADASTSETVPGQAARQAVQKPTPSASMTMTELLPHLPGEWRTKLQAALTEMQGAVERLRQQNARNEEMLRLSLGFIDQFYDMLTQAVQDVTPSYGPDGEREAERQPLFNRRA